MWDKLQIQEMMSAKKAKFTFIEWHPESFFPQKKLLYLLSAALYNHRSQTLNSWGKYIRNSSEFC